MEIEKIKELTAEELEKRSMEIADTAKTADEETLKGLKAELDEIEKRKAELKKEAEERRKAEEAVKRGEGEEVTKKPEAHRMDLKEIRNSEAYVNAYANYIKTGDDKECRALLTENATDGTIPVPALVDGVVRTAYDKTPILSRVNRTNLKGIVKVGFELSADDAVIHAEGADAPAEEALKLGIVTLTPETIKKWITISDEALDMNGSAFVEYVYSEITYRILKKAEDEIVAKILAAPATATATAASVATMTSAGAIDDIYNAEALLSDEAVNPVIIMSKAKKAKYMALKIASNYAVDPFDGMEVLYNNSLGDSVIVGDLGSGITANFPNGNDVTFKYDDLSLAEKDLVKIVGRLPIAIEVVACGRFATIKAASA